MPDTPPKMGQTTGGSFSSAATAAETKQQANGTGATDALAFADQLLDYAQGLKSELRGYGDPNTVGRDVARLRQFFGNIHQCEVQIAQAMGVSWTPQDWNST